MRTLIRNSRTVTDKETVKEDILVEDSLILKRAADLSREKADRIIDAEGLYCLPGLIDAHTHYHLVARGTITADRFFEGSRAAVFGGVTTVIDFSDQKKEAPITETARERIALAEKDAVVDFSLHQSVNKVHPDTQDQLQKLKAMGISAIKIFTTYKKAGFALEPADLETLLRLSAEEQLLVCVHAEDDDMIEKLGDTYADVPHPPELHPVLRPSEAEAKAVLDVGRMCGRIGLPLYVVHLSSEAGLKVLRQLKREGGRILAETTPHYLTLTNDLLKNQEGALYIMTPPLRTEKDNNALWEGLETGDIQIIATDHCSFTREQKLSSRDCKTIFPGIPGTEEMFPVAYTGGVEKGRFSLNDLVGMLSTSPARTFGIYPQKGSLEEGTDADLILFDPEPEYVISDDSVHSAAGYSPYAGMKVRGRVTLTMRRGEILLENGSFNGRKGSGKFIPAGTPGVY